MANFLHSRKRNKKRSHTRREKFHPMIERGISPYIPYTHCQEKKWGEAHKLDKSASVNIWLGC